MINNFFDNSTSDDHWVYVSDMMTGLMMIFLFISVAYIQSISKDFYEIQNNQNTICNDIRNEFSDNPLQWKGMSLCEKGVLISFSGKNSLFDKGRAELSDEFKSYLESFFPKLMRIIIMHKNLIQELRIEGHTDSSYPQDLTKLEGYIYNTRLSQKRSREVMDFVLTQIEDNEAYMEWAFDRITANGMSSSNRKFSHNNTEDERASRRVEFRIRVKAEDRLITKAEQQLREISNGVSR